jgi:UDP-N-acetylglucosamine--N-acetylmuramyl-(pentapeptide) pyrophosphoryl-undecaprenol N-acetylglucosamine transferase
MVSPKEVDQQAVRQVHDMEVVTLPAVGLQRGGRMDFMASLARATLRAHRCFRRHRPDAVLSMGGFAGAGPVLAARTLRLPVYLHESNAVPGRANRWLARFAREVFVGFPSAASRFRRGAAAVGTPVRPQFTRAESTGCRRLLGLNPDRPVVLVAGGSQGAFGINDLVTRALPGAKALIPQWQWLHLTGPHDEARVRQAYTEAGVDAQVHAFFDRMEVALGAASAMISRAGGSSLAEIAAMRTPALLIPFPHATDQHQFHNAAAFEATGAAVLTEQSDLKPESLLAAMCPLVEDPATRLRLQTALAAWHHPEAASVISRKMLGLRPRQWEPSAVVGEGDTVHRCAFVVT